jgi:signal transduction histidine kinase
MFRSLRHVLIALYAVGAGVVSATSVKLEPVEATTGADSRFAEAVDGIEKPGNGWVVPQSAPQQGIFRCVPPLEAGRVRFWLEFYSGHADTCFGEFSISATSDPRPSRASHWQPVFAVAFNADQDGWLERAYPHLHFLKQPPKTNALIEGVLPEDRVTGIRLETWPSQGTAILTEFKLLRLPTGTTNIALGRPVTASGPLPQRQYAECLTDGLVGSYAHPANPGLAEGFYFQVDLGRTHELDHISLRSPAQSGRVKQFTPLQLQLFDEEPAPDTAPLWMGHTRDTGTVLESGAVSVVRSADGDGKFRGRYLRILSTRGVDYSPLLAEVEVYESIVPSSVTAKATGQVLRMGRRIRLPADTDWVSFTLQQPPLPDGLMLGRRWRILGFRDGWLPANSVGEFETRGLPAGNYLLEIQLRHTDMEWNDVALRVPLIVVLPWWKSRYAQFSAALIGMGLGALIAWWAARRHMARQVAELEQRQEVARERARIARDMHDVVGAQLTQLSVMHEIFARQHDLPPGTQGKLHELSSTARAAIASLDEAVWAINPRNDTLQNVVDYLGHAAGTYLRPLGMACRHDISAEWPDRSVSAHKRHELLRAFMEALQNVAKHAEANTVKLTVRCENDTLEVLLEDDGRGLPAEFAGQEKNGIDNMMARLESVGGTCQVSARPDGGTLVKMRLPI